MGTGLPAVANRLVARESDLAAVDDALRAGRLVTIAGPGGVGKTRLAVEVARGWASPSRTVAFVDLAALDEDQLVPTSFAHALGMPGTSDDPISDVSRFLAEFEALLVVDNCEHLLDAVTAAVMPLLEACPQLRVVATSREALRLSGELIWTLGPLPPDDAVQLFIERAEAIRSGATEGQLEAIRELCDRLEGIPLALELAAGRTVTLSAQAILSRLTDRFELLSARIRDTPARQRSLRATIEWSVGLMDEQEHRAFTRLSVFPGSFSLDAADSIADTDLNLLQELVTKSLVFTVTGGELDLRYRMLDAVRAYARERLPESEAARLRPRHLAFYLERAEQVHRSNALGGSDAEVRALAEDLDNFRLGLDWASEHDVPTGLRLLGASREAWFSRSQAEGRDWARRLLALHPAADLPRAMGLLCAGRLAIAHQDHAAGHEALRECIEIAEALSEPGVLAAARHYLGISGMLSRDLESAAQSIARSIELFRTLGQAQGIGRGLGILGFVALYRGEPLDATRIFEDALEIVDASGDAWGVGQVSLGLGLTAKARGESSTAIMHLSRSAASLVAAGDATILGVAVSTLAGLTFDNDPRGALRIAAAAVASRRRIGGEYPPATVVELDSVRERGRQLLGVAATDAEWDAGLLLTPAQIMELVESSTQPPERQLLTKRQREVAVLVAEGLTNAQIAARLHLSERTIENHVFNALSALGLHKRVQLAVWMTERRAAAVTRS
jgi:non-specific serine/threonine protein kinase